MRIFKLIWHLCGAISQIRIFPQYAKPWPSTCFHFPEKWDRWNVLLLKQKRCYHCNTQYFNTVCDWMQITRIDFWRSPKDGFAQHRILLVYICPSWRVCVMCSCAALRQIHWAHSPTKKRKKSPAGTRSGRIHQCCVCRVQTSSRAAKCASVNYSNNFGQSYIYCRKERPPLICWWQPSAPATGTTRLSLSPDSATSR